MATKILSAATFGLAGLLLGGKKKPAPAPAPTSDPVMPLPDDEAVKAAKRRSIIEQLGRGGRSSTILSDQSGDKLGG